MNADYIFGQQSANEQRNLKCCLCRKYKIENMSDYTRLCSLLTKINMIILREYRSKKDILQLFQVLMKNQSIFFPNCIFSIYFKC